ncbi:hypothetical protein H8Z72_22635 (plasmid) [Xanthomonas citri pv. citri]|uniref:hypothetical protein n=1 Tax=Xanthomonas citri TaxID=346 RepID=UPI0019338F17|nr:hypothetical protein [Xanthomonas citri]QRD62672.1 hypothetical protein H8Z74_23550 [Xanthomonas citri pv. citri]QRD67207.1 hypothetical protein H8Z73_22530 [Xanthomonas citri pv. citri]QRD71748.1 hypothetical protein H8Z72_22635 [Xanthomonas citri pv. citri]
MTTFRIEFEWRSAMPGRCVRGNCFRFSSGVYFVRKAGEFDKADLPMLTREIGAEARRRGMQDVSIRIKQVSHLMRNQATPDGAGHGGCCVH